MRKTKKIVPVILLIAASCLAIGVRAVQARFDDTNVVSDHIFSVFSIIRNQNVASLFVTRSEFNLERHQPSVSQAPVIFRLAAKNPVTHESYNVFQSVVIPVGKLSAFKQWTGVLQHAESIDSSSCFNMSCESSAGIRMANAAKRAVDLAPLEALQLINLEVNRAIMYRSDQGDHWATLAESAARGTGDCEDYAIAKMALLFQIGFSQEQVQFIVLKDARRQVYHAVLAVHIDGQHFILDSLRNAVVTDDSFGTYVPIVSFVGSKSFIHGFTGTNSRVAALGEGGYSAIQLGDES